MQIVKYAKFTMQIIVNSFQLSYVIPQIQSSQSGSARSSISGNMDINRNV